MLIEAARRAEAAAKEMLALVNAGNASCEEMREMLPVSKATVAITSAAQTSAAANIAARDRHGDGGAEVLASGAGLSRQEARSQVKTAEALRDTPKLRDAVESGRVSVANARRLGEAVSKTSAADVADDGDLLAKAESMRPEQFAKEARRWTVDRQGDGGESEHARQRARRCVRIWNADDGMVHLRGEFDSVTGERIRNRLRIEAGRMHDGDRKHAAANGNSNQRRSFDQCMADALDYLTSNSGNGGSKPLADICVAVHVDDATGALLAEIPGGDRLPTAVLDELTCNSVITPTIYNTRGALLWQGHSKRTATSTQLKALKAIYGGCFACGFDFDACQAHHVRPVSQGGPTDIDNLVPACWTCHNKIHHFGWQIHGPPGKRSLHPPNTVTYGPAHAPERPSLFCSEATAPPDQARLREPVAAQSPNTLMMRDPQETPAPDHPTADRFRQRGARAAQHSDPPPRPGPAAARAALRASLEGVGPEPLFTPD